MGAWGEGAFDNDTAADWCGKFENADLAAGLQLITDALAAVAQADAAAELVALINGQPIDESPYNQTARQWTARVHSSSDRSLTNLARQAVARVTGQNSELAELWDDTNSASWGSARR
jgi:Domain of unknown function (DUF4259)